MLCSKCFLLPGKAPLEHLGGQRDAAAAVQKDKPNKASSSCQYLVHDFLLLLHSTNSQHNLQVPTCLGNTQPLISSPPSPCPPPKFFLPFHKILFPRPTRFKQVLTMYSGGSLMLLVTLGFRFQKMNIKKRFFFFWVLENKYFVLKNINKNKNKNLGSKKKLELSQFQFHT